jgi:hypothetical protein
MSRPRKVAGAGPTLKVVKIEAGIAEQAAVVAKHGRRSINDVLAPLLRKPVAKLYTDVGRQIAAGGE